MKFLENAKFDALSSLLSTDIADKHLEVRLESYSCKMAGCDKRLLRFISQEGGGTPESLVPLSIPNEGVNLSKSPYGKSAGSDTGPSLLSMADAVSVKTLSFLIGVLNASFKPDYDFSSAKSNEFFRQPLTEAVMSTVNSQLLAGFDDLFHTSSNQFWSTIDDEINLQECEIYSYHPDFASDPFSEAVWSFNYLFYNKRLKRVVFLCCRCLLPEHIRNDVNEAMEVYDLEYSPECSVDGDSTGDNNSPLYLKTSLIV